MLGQFLLLIQFMWLLEPIITITKRSNSSYLEITVVITTENNILTEILIWKYICFDSFQ